MSTDTVDQDVVDDPKVASEETPEMDDMKAEMLANLDDAPDTDTDTDEPTEAPDTDTEPGNSEDSALLEEMGLKQYKSVREALTATRDKELRIQDLQNTNHDLESGSRELRETVNRIVAQRGSGGQPTGEELAELFQENPEAALHKMGYVTRSQLSGLMQTVQGTADRLDHQEFVHTLEGFDDLKSVASHFKGTRKPPERGQHPIWDAMSDIYANTESLQGNLTDLIPLLFEAAKGRVSTTPVETVSSDKKRRATTTSRGRQTNNEMPNFDAMKEHEISKWLTENM